MANAPTPLAPESARWQRRKRIAALVSNTFIYAFLLAFAFLTLFPFFWMLLTSFKVPGDVFRLPPSFVPSMLLSETPFANYREVLFRFDFLRYAGNSLLVATTAASGQLVTCSLAGFAFARMAFPLKNYLFGALIFTLLIPIEVTIIPEFLLMMRLGWLNSYLPLIVPSLMVGAFGTFLMTEFFKTFPPSLEEAATIDGASAFAIYRLIYLPLATPALASLFVVAFITNWNELLRPVLYISNRNLRTLPLGLTALQGQYESSWTLLMAGSIISILPMIVVYLLAQKYIIRGFLSSGIK
jgi:multiple sugar transport system permease protein